jgi:tetratricopeptide (TPR) repeat protein
LRGAANWRDRLEELCPVGDEPVDAVGMDVGSAEDTLTTVSPEVTDAAEAAGETEAQETFAEIAVEPEPDPDRQTAREAEFRAAMTGFLTALKAGDLEQAAGALAKARELNPGAPVLGDAGRRLESAKKERELQRLARQGRQSEASEDWQQAIAIYTRAIALSPNASFAGEGKRRAGERLELRKKLDHYLGDPGRLQADQPRANALLLLEHLERIPNPGPRLSADSARLADLLAAAVRPVTLRIRSDEQTEVTIYRVGRLGRFLQHEIELRPGNYTVVGYREGFRDVRRKISLRPGVEAEIQVRCEERI